MENTPARTPACAVTDDQLARELSFIEAFRLTSFDAWIASLVSAIDATKQSDLQGTLREALVARLAPYHAWHQHIPFPTIPPGTLDQGPITIGHQLANGAPVTLGTELQHLLIYAPTGGGKSHFLAHILRAILEQSCLT